jgi:hypothetical protein
MPGHGALGKVFHGPEVSLNVSIAQTQSATGSGDRSYAAHDA